MGLFNKIKNMFKKYDDEVEEKEDKSELEEEPEIDEESEEEEETEEESEIDEENQEEKEPEEEEQEIEEEHQEEEESEVEEELQEEEEPEVEESMIEEKPKKEKKKLGFFKKKKEDEERKSVKIYEKGLSKSRQGFVSKLANLTNKYSKITEEYFEELEEILIMADIGVNTVMDFIDRLKRRCKHENIIDSADLKEVIIDEMFIIYVNNQIVVNKINYSDEGPTVILFVGVNGVGKTTTIGKLAYKLTSEGRRVLLIAGDTFRAGAVEQIKEWANTTNSKVIYKENSDPSSVVFDGLNEAIRDNYDVVLIDTAGRLQNKTNLMEELAKINRVIKKVIPNAPHETLLVIDATTGQNGISQAKSFKEITDITGIVLTKLDGTAKGGIVLAIKEGVDIPVKYVGLGERKEDLRVFDIEKYIYGLFKDM